MYPVTTVDQSQQQVDALSAAALAPFAEARATLEVAPRNGAPYHKHSRKAHASPDVRPGRAGDIVYLILEDLRRVDILVVVWLR